VAKAKSLANGNVTKNNTLFNTALVVALFVIVIALFHAFVFSDRMLYSSDFIQGAGFARSFYVDYVKAHGTVPVWNPYQFCGIPYIDSFHGDTFYPFSTIKFFMNIYRYFGWILLLHIFLGGITMFFCARVFRRSQMASALAAVGYMLAAYFVSQVAPGHDGKVFVTALFPLTIMLIELAFIRRPLLHFTLLGLTIGIIILTPHPQMAYYTLWACAFYFVFKAACRWYDEKSFGTVIKPTTYFVVAVIVGLMISAIHFYPGYNYVKKYSPRSDDKKGVEWAKSWSIHPEEAVSLLVPEFCGVSGEKGNTYWGRNFFKDNLEYSGAVPLMLGLLAVIMVRRRKTWFFGGLALFALIYALAGDTPFFYLFYHLIPNVKSTRAWSMIMFLFSFSTALLAAFGVDFVIEKSRQLKDAQSRAFLIAVFGLPAITLLGALFFATAPEAAAGMYKSIFYSSIQPQKNMVLQSYLGSITAGFWKTFFFLIIPAIAIWMYSKRKAAVIILWVIVACAIVDAYRVDTGFIRTFNQDIFKPNAVSNFFKSQPGKFRVLDMAGQYLPTNYLPLHHIEEMTAYQGNQPKWYYGLLGGTAMRNMLNINLMNMTNTRYLLISPQSPVNANQLSAAGFKLLQQFNGMQVFENPYANHRAYLVHKWVIEPDENRMDTVVLSQSFNVHTEVGLLKDPSIAPTPDSVDVSGDRVDIVSYENGYIELKVNAVTDGILVLADNWYPSWRGFVDGKEVDVMMANAAFRGIVVPAGEHKIEFKYISPMQTTGRLVTLIGLLFVGIVIGAQVLNGRKKD